VLRILALAGLTAVMLAVGELGPEPMPLRGDFSRAALTSLGREYDQLQQWTTAISATTDTMPTGSSEGARVLADQLARLMLPLEENFEKTTAALSTAQLELVLPLWERMAFAHAGFVMLQEEAAAMGGDPTMEPVDLHELVEELSAVLELATEMQRQILNQLTAPPPTSIRIT
jgi:hypothetical protein